MKTEIRHFLEVWLLVVSAALFVSCADREILVDKSSLTGNDYRLFQETPVWGLAKVVWDEDIESIRRIVSEGKVDPDFQEPRFGNSLLMVAVHNRHYEAAKALLEVGADPNLYGSYNGSSAIIDAAGLSSNTEDDTKFLKLLLKYGADPNDVEIGQRRQGNTKRNTPLLQTSGQSLNRVRMLVDAGANVNYRNEFGVSPLSRAFIQDKLDIVLFLLEHGVDYNTPIVERNGKKLYLVHMLRELMVPIGLDEHKEKMKIVAYLNCKGIDYKEAPVPDFIIEEAKSKYPKKWEQYLAEY